MTKSFKSRVINEHTVDAKKYRYIYGHLATLIRLCELNAFILIRCMPVTSTIGRRLNNGC